MPTYRFQDANKNTIQFTADRPPTDEELDALFAKHHPAYKKNTDGPTSGFGQALVRGVDQITDRLGDTADVLGFPTAGENLRGLMNVPGQSAAGQFMTADQAKDGSFAFRYLPKATVEQAPQFAGALAAAKTGARLGSFLGPKGALVGGLAGPVIFEAIQALGPIAKERAQNDGRETPNAQDFNTAMASAAGMGILNTLAPASTGTLRRAVIETVTEGGQSGIEQTGSTIETQKGLTIDPRQIVGEGIIGGTSAGLVDTTLSTAQRLVGRKDNAPVSDRESQAQADFARRITSIVEDSKRGSGPNYNLRDVDPDSRSGAKQVIDSAHSDMAQELKTLIGTLKDRLKPQKTDLLDQILEKSNAALAAVKAKNKVKNVVEPRDFDAFEKLTGDLMEGQRAINLMHEMNELTRVYSEGLTGGVSRFTDALAPLGALDNYSNTGGVMQQFARPLATAALAMSNPGLAAAQVGAFATGRAIDGLTGRRSRVRTYVRANERGPGQPTPTGRSITDEKAQEELELQRAKQAEAEEKARKAEEEIENARLLAQTIERQGQEGMPLPGNHPLMTSLFILGDQNTTVEDIVDIAEQFVDNSDPIIAKAAQDLIASRTQRLKEVANLSPLIAEMKKAINSDTQFWINKERQIAGFANNVEQNVDRNLSQKEINYNRGILANQRFADALKIAVLQDSEVTPRDKAKIASALNFVSSSTITQNPVARMQTEVRRLQEENVAESAITKYFLPYVQRVQDQQNAGREVKQAVDQYNNLQESRRPPLTYTPPRRQKSGKYVGAPRGINTPAKLASLRKNVKEIAKKGEYGRFWYERSGQAILDITGGDKADARKLVAAIAITSPQTGVDTNFEFAIQAYYQYKNGQPIQTGIFPTSMGEKLTDVFESDKGFTGRKTGNFENNLLRAIDEQTEQGVTTDLWMMRAFGYPSDAATDLNYDFVENETAKIAEDLGWEPQQVQAAIWVEIKSRMEAPEVKQATDKASQRKGYFKFVKDKNGKKVRKWKDLASEQAHGKLWVKKALAYQPTELQRQSAKFDYKDAALNKMALVSVESIPSTSANHLPEIFDAPDAEIIEYHHAMDKAFLDDDGYDIIARQLGMLQMGASVGIGSWEGRNDPVTQNEIIVPRQYRVKEDGVMSEDAKDLVHAYAAAKGILLKQDAIGYHRPFFKDNTKKTQNGIDYDIGRPFTKDEVQRISTLLSSAGIEPIATANGVRFINFDDGAGNFFSGLPNFVSGANNPDFQSTVISAIETLQLEDGQDTGVIKRFVSDNGLIENNWTENKNGEDYLNNNRLRGRPDLQRRVRDIVAELQPRVRQVEEDFSAKYGWSPNAELNTAYDNDPGPDGPPGARQLVESRAPALAQPEQLELEFRTPTLKNVQTSLPKAKEVAKFVVGKQGTPFAEGIDNFADAMRLADHLNLSVGVYDSLAEFGLSDRTLAAFDQSNQRIVMSDIDNDLSIPDYMRPMVKTKTLIHEISHALESMAIGPQEGSYVAQSAHELATEFHRDSIKKNSLREKIRNEVLANSDIKREIDELQRNILVRQPISKINNTAREVEIYTAYIKSDPEFAVDPVAFYLYLPGTMRRDAPKTAELIRGHFNRASSPITIFANPLATILAILMAGAGVALRGPGEDDEEGALNMQRGALSV